MTEVVNALSHRAPLRPPCLGTRPTRPDRDAGRPSAEGSPTRLARDPPARRTALPAYLAATCGGTAIALAWWAPGTSTGTLLGWIAAALLIFAIRAGRSYLPAYCCGLACYGLGFYWIFGTVSAFGGFGAVSAALIFALFVALGAVQFLAFAFLHHNLGPAFDACGLRPRSRWSSPSSPRSASSAGTTGTRSSRSPRSCRSSTSAARCSSPS